LTLFTYTVMLSEIAGYSLFQYLWLFINFIYTNLSMIEIFSIHIINLERGCRLKARKCQFIYSKINKSNIWEYWFYHVLRLLILITSFLTKFLNSMNISSTYWGMKYLHSLPTPWSFIKFFNLMNGRTKIIKLDFWLWRRGSCSNLITWGISVCI
jgi:hypothetical protein